MMAGDQQEKSENSSSKTPTAVDPPKSVDPEHDSLIAYPTFEKPWDFSDLILNLDDKKFHVHKAVVSMWSPILKHQILQLKSSGEPEVILEPSQKLAPEDFVEMLQTIYPPNKPINEGNCEKLVTIANAFNMFELLRRCEKYLINEMTPSLKLLVFAQEEHLSKLLQKCTKYCSRMNLEELKKSSFYTDISPANLCNLLEVRCLKMEQKLKKSEIRSWELSCTLRAIHESWGRKEGACVQHRNNGMHQENCNECLHAIRRQIGKLCELALNNPSDNSD